MAWLKSMLRGGEFGPAEPSISSDPLDDFNVMVLARVDIASRGSDVSQTTIWTDQSAGSTLYHVKGMTICTVHDGASSIVQGGVLINLKPGTSVTFTTATYASGTGGKMKFVAHVVVERL